MRYLFLLGALLLSLLPVLPAQAASDATFTIRHITEPRVYGGDFNVLALDFDISTNIGEVLNTLTLTSSGTARNGIEVAKMRLWLDTGDAGFQGWGYDKLLAEGQFTNVWEFKNISHIFTASTQRFFVSLESNAFISDKIFQVALSQPQDAGNDGVFQTNDKGVFFSSGIATTVPLETSTTIFFKESKIDQQGPLAFVNGFVYGENNTLINPDQPIILTGQARDRGLGITKNVIVNLNGKQYIATNTGTNFSTWSASIDPEVKFINGELFLTTMDGDNNTWISPNYDVYVDLRQPSLDKSFVESSVDGNELMAVITLRSEEGELLPLRELLVTIKTGGQIVSTLSGLTDDFGKLDLLTTLNSNTKYTLEIMYDGDVFSTFSVEIGSSQPVPNPNPTPVSPTTSFKAGDLIKGSLDAVYYYSSAGTRHVFVTQAVYDTWYKGDFSTVKTITDAELASIPLGKNVGFRPGSMLTAPSINEVYFVDRGQILKHIGTEQVAKDLFGSTWNKQIHDLQESLLFNYTFGPKINFASNVDLSNIQSTQITIDDELALS